MGLFSKKKKFSKKEKETLEKAREELKKIKDSRDVFDSVPNKIIDNVSDNTEEKLREEQKQNEDLEKLNQNDEEIILANPGKIYDDTTHTGMCCALDCNVPESVLNGKECKFCNRFCCIDHLLCHKHDCVKD